MSVHATNHLRINTKSIRRSPVSQLWANRFWSGGPATCKTICAPKKFAPLLSCLLEAEQLLGVATADFDAIRFADGSMVEPFGGLTHIFARIIDRVQNAVRALFQHRIDQRLRAEVPARRI